MTWYVQRYEYGVHWSLLYYGTEAECRRMLAHYKSRDRRSTFRVRPQSL